MNLTTDNAMPNEITPNTILQLTYADLEKIVYQLVLDTRNAFLAEKAAEREQPTLTRAQVAQRLNVSLGTLNNWDKCGYLKAVRIGVKVLYRESDILNLLNRRK